MNRFVIELRHSIAEQAGNDDSQRLDPGQAPERGLFPAFLFGFPGLLHADNAFDLRSNQSRERLRGHQSGANRHPRNPAGAGHAFLGQFSFRDEGLKEHESGGVKAENGADIKAVRQSQTEGHTTQNCPGPNMSLR